MSLTRFITGTVLLYLLMPAAAAHPATGIVLDTQGRVIFSDLETVWRLDLDGRLTVFRPAVRGRHVHELSIDADGNVYVADYNRRRVLKVAADGKVSRLVRSDAPWAPTGVAVTHDGRVLILETGFTPPNVYTGPRLRELSMDGTLKVLATVGLKENVAARLSSSGEATGENAVAARQASEAERVELALRLYFGLGVVAIGAVAGLKGLARRAGHA